MLRPATPLTVLLLAAFALLLLSVLSVPVTKAIAMGSFKDTKFGVFGFCKDGGSCSPIGIGYDTEQLLDNENQAFDLPVNVRDTVSVILVVHPVATLLTFAIAVMAAASHLHGPGHSARYLLILFLLILVTFLVSILAFLVDVLLFIPHLDVGSYMVLAATIILGLSGIASCAMRRAVVSRMAHKRRVEDNAEMSGENYYTRGAQSKPSTAATNQPMLPMVSGGKGDNLPQFASIEHHSQGDSFSDDRVPLTQLSPSTNSPTAMPYSVASQAQATVRRPPPPRDPYALASNAPSGAYDGRRERGDMGAGGGYGGRSSVGYDRAGSIHSRGGYGPPPSDIYGNAGAQGLPYNDVGHYSRRPSADVAYYGQQPTQSWYTDGNAATPAPRNNYEAYNLEAGIPRADSPPFLSGNGSSGANDIDTLDQYGQTWDRDADVAGMVGLQQDRPRARHETMMTEGSRYSSDEPYLPPRAAWNQASGTKAPRGLPPTHPSTRSGSGATRRRSRSVGGPQDVNYYDGLYSLYDASELADDQPPLPLNPGYGGGPGPTGRARSPSESERSNFTSISQRGVNPRWNPKTRQGPQYQNAPPRRLAQQQKQRRQDLLLDNPDFQLPGGRSKGGMHRAGGGMVPGGAYPTTNL